MRQHRRLLIELNITWYSEHNFYTGFTRDISGGGLFVATGQMLNIGSLIDIKLTLPNNELIESPARVIWVREKSGPDNFPTGMGIAFESLTQFQKESINHYISTREPIFFD